MAEDIAEGLVPSGARLPAHRDLAYCLGVGVGSVSRAYQDLERRGLVHSQHGRGMFVSWHAVRESKYIDLSINVPPHMLTNQILIATFQSLALEVTAENFGQYRPAVGSCADRCMIAGWLSQLGITIPVERLFMSSGAQHALCIALSVACGSGGTLFTEQVTYPGAIQAARHLGCKVIGLEIDQQGLVPLALEAALACGSLRQKRALYVMPTVQNPTTATMGMSRRLEIIEICRAHDVQIIEDDVYSLFTPSGVEPLLTLAPERVFYINGFSKMFSPGLRIGFLVAPEGWLDPVRLALQATTSMASPIFSMLLARWLREGVIASVAATIREEATRRIELAHQHLPGLRVPDHGGSLHAWLPLPPITAEQVARRAAMKGVLVTPPSVVMVDSHQSLTGLRLCLGAPKRSELCSALDLIGGIVRDPARETDENFIGI